MTSSDSAIGLVSLQLKKRLRVRVGITRRRHFTLQPTLGSLERSIRAPHYGGGRLRQLADYLIVVIKEDSL